MCGGLPRGDCDDPPDGLLLLLLQLLQLFCVEIMVAALTVQRPLRAETPQTQTLLLFIILWAAGRA